MRLPNTRIILAATLVLILMSPGIRQETLAAEGFRRILILPFTVHSEKDLTFLKEGLNDMLTSRLTQEGKTMPVSKAETDLILSGVSGVIDEKKALSLGESVDANFVVVGSLTVFGDSISTDVRCIDVAKGSTVVAFNEVGNDQGEVITHVNEFANQVNGQVFGRKTAAVASGPSSDPVPDSRKHPDKIWQESQGGAYIYGAEATDGRGAFSIWKSRKFESAFLGVDVGDVDNDGWNETVFIDHHTLYIYRYVEGRFIKIEEIVDRRFNEFFSVDVADINNNGAAEIFVTSIPANSILLNSFVLEWNGSTFARILEDRNLYFRTIEMPGRGRVLLGQNRGRVNDTQGNSAIYSGPVSELEWQNNDLVPGDRLLLPRGVNIHGFALGDVTNNGTEMVAAYTPREFVRITDSEGKLEWDSDERYGGSATYLEKRTPDFKTRRNSPTLDKTKKVFLFQRLHVVDIDDDGKNELILVQNHDATGQWLDQTRHFRSGNIHCLEWDTLGMGLKWKTQKTGYIPDYVIGDLNNDGKKDVVFAVTLKSGVVMTKARSYIASLTVKD